MTEAGAPRAEAPSALQAPPAPGRREPTALDRWFDSLGRTPFPFQRELWEAWRAGEGGLLVAPTGMGKTLAAWGGPLLDGLLNPRGLEKGQDHPPTPRALRYLWITPLRALARDTASQLAEAVDGVGLDWKVELRTGDTSSSRKSRQRTHPPEVMITTPESASLLLSWEDAIPRLRGLRGVIVDEWHELLGSKRGVQVELLLARLRRWNPALRCWGLSATLGNEVEALQVLLGARPGRIVRGPPRPPPLVETLLPEPGAMGRFPWAGHLGLAMLPRVVDRLQALPPGGSALLFTNTRAQAERWHEALVRALPAWAEDEALGLHHGSLGRRAREAVEAGLRQGRLRAVVCTSTLDLGVDLPAVDLVIQIGSPRGVARLLQRAGRSGHTPDGRSRILGVPTHAFEIVEFAAARKALARAARGEGIEPRRPLVAPLDVLAQHLVTLALGGGFREEALFDEVRTTHAFQSLDRTRWGWILDLVTRGGRALQAYPRYRRVVEVHGVHRVTDPGIARRHRWSVGTIDDDAQLRVRFRRGGTVGTVEESFLSQLRPGDTFLFGGRHLELLELRDLTAWVRLASRRSRNPRTPRWVGGRLPLSTELADAVLETLAEWEVRTERPADGRERGTRERAVDAPELSVLAPLLGVQGAWSSIPRPGSLVVERTRSREGHHLFLYPFLGRLVHEGMAALLAYRIARLAPRSVHLSVNDYGMELLSPAPLDALPPWSTLLDPAGVENELLDALNAAEMARRRFRGVARVAGLLVTGPGGRASARQLQASSGLLWDALVRWDPEHLLVAQARDEVLEAELDVKALRGGLARLQAARIVERETPRLTPLAFPLWAERLQARVSTEQWIDRVLRMARSLERAAG